ncbi:hypothetical protein [Lacrimispora aerotolerans]|nr:hypothetical protein [Lacrimispora aerotolerans]
MRVHCELTEEELDLLKEIIIGQVADALEKIWSGDRLKLRLEKSMLVY